MDKDEKNKIIDKTFETINNGLNSFNEMSTFYKFVTIVTVGSSPFILPKLPRLGPIRALLLGFGSLIRGPSKKSLRYKDVDKIRQKVSSYQTKKVYEDKFVVVRGPKGIGKTLAIKNALAHHWGVCYVTPEFRAGTDSDKIFSESYRSLTKINSNLIDREWAANRVIFWNKLFTLGRRRVSLNYIKKFNLKKFKYFPI